MRRFWELQSHLLPVGGDNADVPGRYGGQALLALGLQQLEQVVHQHLDLRHVEEGGAVGLTLVLPHHPVEHQREALPRDAVR